MIDLDYLHDITNGKANRLLEMAHIFLAQIPQEFTLLKTAGLKANFPKVAGLAHSMRSTVAYMGMAHSLGHRLQQIEEEAKQSAAEPEKIRRLVEALQYQLDLAMDQVRRQIHLARNSGDLPAE